MILTGIARSSFPTVMMVAIVTMVMMTATVMI
jgi:hypothetical protein